MNSAVTQINILHIPHEYYKYNGKTNIIKTLEYGQLMTFEICV